MNIVFFGSSSFAVPALKALSKTKHKISCVVTQPDRKKGRGLYFEGTAVKAAAERFSFKVYQPLQINTNEAVGFLKDLNPDLFIVISYGQILSRKILDIPKIFCINVHASILPQYRGAAPINWAIINGEKTTGISIIKMVEKMDAGEIILQKSTDINDDETVVTLQDRLSRITTELLFDVLAAIENNNYKLTSQDEDKVTLAPKLKKEDGLINWNKSAQQIYNLTRGVLSWPGAFTYYRGKLLKIYKARISKSPRSPETVRSEAQPPRRGPKSPGEIIQISKDGIVVATGKDGLIIQELQIEGKRIMRAEEFIAGHRINPGDRLGYPASSNQI